MEDYTGENRRKQERTLVETELLSVTIKPADTDEEIYGFLVDTSIYGIQISLPVEVTPNTTVELGITKKLADGTWRIANDPYSNRNGYRLQAFASTAEIRNYFGSLFRCSGFGEARNNYFGVDERVFWVVCNKI